MVTCYARVEVPLSSGLVWVIEVTESMIRDKSSLIVIERPY